MKSLQTSLQAPEAGTDNRVLLAHGGGGELTNRLIARHLLPRISNPRLAPLTDAAIVKCGGCDVIFTTDSYVVTPLEFPGGDIGRLAVAGTVNDLAVMGALPVALSLGLILEEGLAFDVFDRIVESISATAREAGVEVVTGDTKVIERRRTAGQEPGGGLLINTSGIGQMRVGVSLDMARVRTGDLVLVNGFVGEHGLTIMSTRAGIGFDSVLRSDAAPLNGLIDVILRAGESIRFIRDATRGGVAGVLADITERAGLSIEVDEARLPVSSTARQAAEMLGLDPITVANEGKIVCVVAETEASAVLAAMRSHPYGREAAIVGRVTAARPPLVEMLTSLGGRRIVQRPYGEELPRIC